MKRLSDLIDVNAIILAITSTSVYQMLSGINDWLVLIALLITALYSIFKAYWGFRDRIYRVTKREDERLDEIKEDIKDLKIIKEDEKQKLENLTKRNGKR